MKRCFKCGELKDISEFYVHSPMADGHLNKCKECTKRDVHQNYLNRLEHYREYEKQRFYDKNRRECQLRYAKQRRKNHPEKIHAERNAQWAIRSGKLIPKPCERCGNPKSQAHHPDYNKQLEVVWLCFKCHRKEHGQLKYETAV